VIDWDSLVLGPLMEVFGETTQVQYTRVQLGQTFSVDGIFDEAYTPGGQGELQLMSARPVLGVRLSQFPADYDPEDAQGDEFIVRGRTYVVKAGKPDSHGGARLEANLAP
jgi:hypothetical protein